MLSAIERLVTGYESGRFSRREFVQSLAAFALAARSTAAQRSPIAAHSINHVTLMVSDIERSARFYEELLGLSVKSEQDGGVNLAVGDSFLGIYDRALLGIDPQIHHVCFGISDFDADGVVDTLSDRGVDSHVRMRDDTVPEVYFADPDGLVAQLQDVSYCGGSGPLGNVCPR